MRRGGSEPCALCGERDFDLAARAHDRLEARREDFRYVRCRRCGLLSLDPLPRESEIPGLYPRDYHTRIEAGRRDLSKPVNRMAIRYFYGVDRVALPTCVRALWRVLSTRILAGTREPQGNNRLLDVGCGSGATLELYRDLGWSVAGIEPSPAAQASCRTRGLEVHLGSVFDAPFRDEFDLVLMSHVIEHVREPVAVLRRAAEFLAPAGKLIVTTPNARALGFAVYGSCWYNLEAPRHLHLFDARTLRRAAEAAGLAVKRLVSRASALAWRLSHHYRVSQGEDLPLDIDARRAVIERTWRRLPRYRLRRELIGPLTFLAARVGRGEVIEAECGLAPG